MARIHATRLLGTLALAALAAGCGSGSTAAKSDDTSAADPAASVLMLNGRQVGADGTRVGGADRAASTSRPKPARRRTTPTRTTRTWPVPPLLANGALDDGPDPFASSRIQPQPLPIEDDPKTTTAIDRWTLVLHEIDQKQWDRWMKAGLRSPWSDDIDSKFASMVKLTVERCGGARSVASGVVLAPETVVTSVHAVESIQRRVRVSPGGDDSQRLAAIVRYLDVDDDIAVLKVPGLTAPPMDFHTPSGTNPEWGYAYGVSQGGLAGVLHRTPAVVATQESTIDVEQPDGFAKRITDRSVYPAVAGVDTGFSGGVITASNDKDLIANFGFHGLIRARVPYRSNTGAIVVPSRLVRAALSAASALDPWFEHRPGHCPQWLR